MSQILFGHPPSPGDGAARECLCYENLLRIDFFRKLEAVP